MLDFDGKEGGEGDGEGEDTDRLASREGIATALQLSRAEMLGGLRTFLS